MWKKMPETMLEKCCEAKALRMAFPDFLGGVYTQEEMEQAEEGRVGGVKPDQPGPNDGIQHEGYHVPGHLDPRIAAKPIAKCDPVVLRDVVEKIEAKYEGKKIPPKGQEFINEAEPVIASYENSLSFDEEESDE
jgi:hypothetical protein